jgi:hypothetical protein
MKLFVMQFSPPSPHSIPFSSMANYVESETIRECVHEILCMIFMFFFKVTNSKDCV